MGKKHYEIKGIIRRRTDRHGVKGLTVEAYEADLFFDDKLGSTITDTQGVFQIIYDERDFRELFEKSPDLYLEIHNRQGELIYSTKSRVRFNARREEHFLIELTDEQLGKAPAERDKIGGIPVDRNTFSKVKINDFLALARAFRGEKIDDQKFALFKQLNPFLVAPLKPTKDYETTHCLNPHIRFIQAALKRLETPKYMLDILDSVLFGIPLEASIYETNNFSISYTSYSGPEDDWDPTSGTVLAKDSPVEEVRLFDDTQELIGTTQEGIEVPNYIQKLAIWLEYAFNRYTQQYSLLDPRVGGAKIQVTVEYIVGASGFGGNGIIHIDNDLDDSGLASTSVHELFHCVQTKYLRSPPPELFAKWNPFMGEGTTRCVEDTINDALNRWMDDANWFFKMGHVNISLPELNYSGSLFWKYMCEQHSTQVTPAHEPAIGIDVLRKACEMAETLDAADINVPITLRYNYRTPFYGSFRDFLYAPFNYTELSTNETTFGNWIAANYLQCLRDPESDRRFTFMEASEKQPDGSGLHCPFPKSRDTFPQDSPVTIEAHTNSWAAHYHVFNIVDDVRNVRIDFARHSEFDAPLVQIFLITQNNKLQDLVRFDNNFTKTVNTIGLRSVVVAVAARDVEGNYTLRAESTDPVSDVMITRWNSERGKEHESDPTGWSWHWVSPDVWVDNDDDGEGNNEAHFEWKNPLGGSNHLYVRLRNKGTARAENVSVRFYYQDASTGLTDSTWLPVIESEDGTISQLTGLTLEPGEEMIQFVNWWLPRPSGSDEEISKHFCIKAIVESPNDINIDNKMALSNFCVIEAPPDSADDQLSFDCRVWAEWFPPFQTHRRLPGPRIFEFYVIPRNEVAIDLNRSDYMSIRRMEIQDLLSGEPGRASRESDFIQTNRTPVSKLQPVSKLYHIRFSQREDSKKRTTKAPRFPVENAMPMIDSEIATTPSQINPDTLPPGVADLPMITIIQVQDGQVVGGITYAIVQK